MYFVDFLLLVLKTFFFCGKYIKYFFYIRNNISPKILSSTTVFFSGIFDEKEIQKNSFCFKF